MDSSNLSEIQTIPFNCKNTACNTTPMSCDCCGLKNCGQIFPPVQCFRALPAGIPYDKPSQENFQEKFAMQQPFFQGFPFPSPFYYSLIPPNSCYLNNPLNDREKSQRQPSPSDFEKTCESEEQNFCRKEKTFRSQIPTTEKPTHQNSNPRPEVQCLRNSFYFSHSPESQINFLLHRCSCGDSLPWACTPFLVPVISYCVSWNSHKYNRGITGTTSPQSTNQRNKENTETKKGSSSNLGFCNSTQDHSSEFENTSFKQPENHNKEVGNIRDDIDVYAKEETSVKETVSEIRSECLANIDASSKKTISDISTEMSGLLKIDSEFDLKKNCTSQLESHVQSQKETNNASGVGILYSASDVNPSDLSAEEKDSTDDLTQKSSEATITDITEIPSKKCIKNFTMTDQNNETHFEAPQIFSAAAGDLGGEDCVGYKVNIHTIEENETENILQETRTEEKVHAPEIFYQALEDLEKNKSSRIPQKYSEGYPSPAQNVRSSTAKLAASAKDIKEKNSKENLIKNIKRYTNQESSGLRRRHNCLSFEKMEKTLDQNPKTQKTKIMGLSQQQNQGATRQKKVINDKSPRKDEKSLKVPTTNISQKFTKWTNKNTGK